MCVLIQQCASAPPLKIPKPNSAVRCVSKLDAKRENLFVNYAPTPVSVLLVVPPRPAKIARLVWAAERKKVLD